MFHFKADPSNLHHKIIQHYIFCGPCHDLVNQVYSQHRANYILSSRSLHTFLHILSLHISHTLISLSFLRDNLCHQPPGTFSFTYVDIVAVYNAQHTSYLSSLILPPILCCHNPYFSPPGFSYCYNYITLPIYTLWPSNAYVSGHLLFRNLGFNTPI